MKKHKYKRGDRIRIKEQVSNNGIYSDERGKTGLVLEVGSELSRIEQIQLDSPIKNLYYVGLSVLEKMDDNNMSKSIDLSALDSQNIRLIMEATGRFEYIENDSKRDVIRFWDNKCDGDVDIRSDWTLEQLMKWIIKVYSNELFHDGKRAVQREITNALGLHNK